MFIEVNPKTQKRTPAFAAALNKGIQDSLAPMGEALKEAIDQTFELQRDPYGRPWAPLSEKTLIARARKTRANKILIVSAMLKNSFAYRVERGARRVKIAPGGPAAVYASTHQFGRGNIPKRQMVPDAENVPQALMDELKATVADSIRRAFAAARKEG